ILPFDAAFPGNTCLWFQESGAGRGEAVVVDVGEAQHILALGEQPDAIGCLPSETQAGAVLAVGMRQPQRLVAILSLAGAVTQVHCQAVAERLIEMGVPVAKGLTEVGVAETRQ